MHNVLLNIITVKWQSVYSQIARSDDKLRHVCPSAWNSSADTGWISMKSDIGYFLKIVEKIQGSLDSGKNNKYFI